MTKLTRHIVVVLQIVALIAYPQMMGGAAASGPISAETVSDNAAADHENESDHQVWHHHDQTAAGHIHGLRIDYLTSGQDEGGLHCHPCCIGGQGPCVVIITALQDLVKPSLVRVFNASRLASSYSLEITPLPHPPKDHI